jgi:hypothetical protein
MVQLCLDEQLAIDGHFHGDDEHETEAWDGTRSELFEIKR